MPLKSNALSDTDIKKILKSQGVNVQIYMKDELPSKLKQDFYVINLANAKDDNNGTHWVCMYYTPNRTYYFDAYGFPAALEVDKIIRPYIYNTKDLQSYSSTACGFYCIAFILFMNLNKNKLEGFMKFINLFSNDTKENDKILYNLLYK
jgi:hypothetical protein